VRIVHPSSRGVTAALVAAAGFALVVSQTATARAAARDATTAPTISFTSDPESVTTGSPATAEVTLTPGSADQGDLLVDFDVVALTVIKPEDLTISYPAVNGEPSGTMMTKTGSTNLDVVGSYPSSPFTLESGSDPNPIDFSVATDSSNLRGPFVIEASLDVVNSDGTVTQTLGTAQSPVLTARRATPYKMGQNLVLGRASTKSLYYATSNTTGGGTPLQVAFGTTGDEYLPADLSGTGDDFPVIYRPSTRSFYVADESKLTSKVLTILDAPPIAFGTSGDIPLAGNFNPDPTLGGFDEPAVYRPSTSTFYIDNDGTTGVRFGIQGDIPLVGDWTGSGLGDSFGVYRPSNHTFYLRTPNGTITAPFGTAGDKPIVGDWNGAGTTLIGVHRGNTFILSSSNTSPSGAAPFALGSASDTATAAFSQTENDLLQLADNAILTPSARAGARALTGYARSHSQSRF
jgi:hypothetical protein